MDIGRRPTASSRSHGTAPLRSEPSHRHPASIEVIRWFSRVHLGWSVIFALTAAFSLLCLRPTSLGAADGRRLIDFKLQDQFHRTYRAKDYAGRPLLFLVGDREGSVFTYQWASAIDRELESLFTGGPPASIGVAHLDGVPFFLKGMVRGKFPQEKDSWVLLDWKGRFYHEYSLEPKRCNLLLFAEDGRLLFKRAVTAPDSAEVAAIGDRIRDLLLPSAGP